MPLDLRSRWAARPRALPVVARVRAVNWRPFAVALFVAVVFGIVGGSIGQWAGWRTAGALPTDAEAEAIARLALGGPAPEAERKDEFFGYDPAGNYGPGYVRFTLPADPAAASFPWQAKDIRVRLDTAGWAIDKTWAGDGPDESSDPRRASNERAERVDGLLFVADKGDWRVRYSAGPGDEARLEIVRLAPVAVPAGGALGGLMFAGVGWLIGLRSVRRATYLGGFAKRCAWWLVAASVVGMLPLLLLTLIRLATGYAQISSPQIPLWTAFTEPVLLPLAVASVILLCSAAAVTAGATLPEPVAAATEPTTAAPVAAALTPADSTTAPANTSPTGAATTNPATTAPAPAGNTATTNPATGAPAPADNTATTNPATGAPAPADNTATTDTGSAAPTNTAPPTAAAAEPASAAAAEPATTSPATAEPTPADPAAEPKPDPAG